MDLIRRVGALQYNAEPCRAGYIWLVWNIFASLLPLWGTTFLLLLFGKNISLYGMLKNGEFVLYASAFAGGALYVIRRDLFVSRSIATALLVILLVISSFIFVAITVLSVNVQSGLPHIDEHVLTISSVIVFVITVIFSFFITVADAAGFGMDIPDALKKDEEKLGADFDRLLAGYKGDAHE